MTPGVLAGADPTARSSRRCRSWSGRRCGSDAAWSRGGAGVSVLGTCSPPRGTDRSATSGEGEISAVAAGTLVVLGYILTAALIALPLTLAITQRSRLLATVSEREALFRRNFTESLTGMLLLRRAATGSRSSTPTSSRPDARRRAGPVVGRYLDRVLTTPRTCAPHPRRCSRGRTRRLARPDRDRPPPRHPRRHRDLADRRPGAADVRRAAARRDRRCTRRSARTEAAEQLTSACSTHAAASCCDRHGGHVIRVNQATTLLTGFTEDELVGHPFWTDLVVPQRHAPVRDMIRERRAARGASWEIDVRTSTATRSGWCGTPDRSRRRRQPGATSS